MSHQYKLKYNFNEKIGAFTKAEIEKEECGACDAYIFASLIFPDSGALSMNYWSADGRNKGKPLPDLDLFKFWTFLAKQLSESETLSREKRDFTAFVFSSIKASVLNAKKDET